jgi:hypothetical protein
MKNWKESGRKRPWQSWRYYVVVCLEGRDNHGNVCRNSRSPDRDSNPAPSEFEVALTT